MEARTSYIIKNNKVEEIVCKSYDDVPKGITLYPNREMAQGWLDMKDKKISFNLVTGERFLK